MVSQAKCPDCGHINQEGSNFCSSCGTGLAAAAGEPITITFVPVGNAEIPTQQVSASSDPYGQLIVTRGPNTGSKFSLEHVITTTGRHPDSDVFLDDVTVSRRHAEIERTASGALVVRDVGSLNGTYLNQKRIDGDTAISDGDELQVGRFKLSYVAGQAE